MPNVDLTDQKRKDLGLLLSGYIEAGRTTQGRAPDWWQRVERFHRNDFPNTTTDSNTPDDPGLPQFGVPFSQPRQDALTAQVCTVIGKQEPYVLNTSDEEEEARNKETIAHRAWDDAEFELRIRTASTICTDTDLVYYRLCPLGKGKVEISVHHPTQVVIFPALPSGLADATIVGHQIWKPRRQIKAAQDKKQNEDGTYYGGVVAVDGAPESEDRTGIFERSGAEPDAAGPDNEADALVELWDVDVRLDLDKGDGERWYRATVAHGDQELLALEEYPFSRPWYFESRYVGCREYYPVTSVGRNLYPLQDCYNALWSAFHASTMMGAMPPVVGPKLSEKFTKYGWGDYIETNQSVQPWSPNVRPMTQPIPVMITGLEGVGDRVARVSQNTMGQSAASDTATEASIKAAGVAVGIEEYIANFSHPFKEMAALTMEIVDYDWEGFAERYGLVDADGDEGPVDLSALAPTLDPQLAQILGASPKPPQEQPVDRSIRISRSGLKKPATWAVNGQSPANSPVAILQAAAQMMEMAQDPTTGLDKYELAKIVLMNGPLKNAQGVQLSKDELAQRLAAPIPNGLPGMGAPVGDANGPQLPGLPPQGLPPGLPNA